MALLEISQLTKRFGGLEAVSGLDFSVERGEIRGLIGPNGAGKTTFFNLVTGMLAPTRGKIFFRGKEITGLKPHAIAGEGLVRTFQSTMLFSSLSVEQNVRMGCHLYRHQRDDVKARAEEILEFFGLQEVRHVEARSLPHGYQRNLGIAVALAAEPEMLLLDEPVTGMNPVETNALMQKIMSIRDRGITILLIEHNMKVIMGYCDQISVLNYGKKIAEGIPKMVREKPEVIAAYLGTEVGGA